LILLGLAAGLSGCQKIEARMELKKGNSAYKQELYPDALAFFERGLELDPTATFAWRSVGFASMAQYRPGNETPENLAHAERAIEAFKKYLVDYPDSPKVLEFLINLYIAIKRLDEGIGYLQQFAIEHPEQRSVHMSMVTLMTKAGKVTEALQWANDHEGARDDPQAYYLIGVNCWDKSYNDVNLNREQRGEVVETGLSAMDRALQLRRDFQTLVYTNLLYREKGKLFLPDPTQPTPKPGKPDPEREAREAEMKAKYDEYIAQANQYAKEAADLRREQDRIAAEQEKAQGIGDGRLPFQPAIPGTEPTPEPTAAGGGLAPEGAEPAAPASSGADSDPKPASNGQNP
jgi:tetratricopeptide (TPR) repeat protein